MSQTVGKFWNQLFCLIPMFTCYCCCMPLFAGIFAAVGRNVKIPAHTVVSDGTPMKPFCTFNDTYCPLANECALELCRASGYMEGSFVNATVASGPTSSSTCVAKMAPDLPHQ